MTDLKLFM